ncbi:tuberous sclerosis 1 protein [Diplogelasinospora grovesii]|uniref:Tuberous sclerosis 1 protein n=1 Tax=Diplogelasinospora grovesii TaxID=303347 RepID=A0AAN6NFK3_9PEZI|nr:tuberous sclerosis 1 protein [Diplogelasinospora grovesii]
MASSGSTKDLIRAIQGYIQTPSLPLPDELYCVIDAYLDKHENPEDGAADRLNDELLPIYEKSVHDCPEKYAAFLAVLRGLRPAMRTPARILVWWDRLLDPILDYLDREKGLGKEVLSNILDLVSNYEAESPADSSGAGLGPYIDRMLSRWMQFQTGKSGSSFSGDFKEAMVKRALFVLGHKDSKGFMICLNGFVVKRESRRVALRLLADFFISGPPHLHLVLQTPLFTSMIRSLQKDEETETIISALVALTMLLPYIPSSLVSFLPTLFNIYARLLFWDRATSVSTDHNGEISKPHLAEGRNPDDAEPDADGAAWEKALADPDYDGHSIPYLRNYFTVLYGLYPINFMDYIRKPQRYLRHANNDEEIDIEVQAMEIRDRSEKFRRRHLLHPNFYNLTIESEKTDFGRFSKSEGNAILYECLGLCLGDEPPSDEDATSLPGPVTQFLNEPADDGEGPDRPLLSIDVSGDSSMGDSLSVRSAHTQQADAQPKRSSSRISNNAPDREFLDTKPRDIAPDSPTLPPQFIHTSKNNRPGTGQPTANDSVPSLALSQQDSLPEQTSMRPAPREPPLEPPVPRTMPGGSLISQLNHEILLLRHDLQWERYFKQQHINHIGELRRKQVREAATEAETQNMIMMNRNLARQLDAAKEAEARIKKESDQRRSMAQKWEVDLSSKLKTLREEQKTWKSEESVLKEQLKAAQAECKKLLEIVEWAEENKVKAEQRLKVIDINADEIEQLRKEIARLSAAERAYQGKELKMQAAMQDATQAVITADQLRKDLAARDDEMQQLRRQFESQVVVLNTKLAEALKNNPSKAATEVAAVYESALAASRAKHSELQKDYDKLMKKYVVLQSSLLDMECDAAEKRSMTHENASSLASTPTATSPIAIRNRSHRGFSDPEAFEGVSHNATPPPGQMSSSIGSGAHHSSTPSGSGAGAGAADSSSKTSPQMERFYGRGGVQNANRKDRKDKKDEKTDKKDKKLAPGLRGIRGLV